eukprot:6414662-Pyramimonas_sp.AAC.1
MGNFSASRDPLGTHRGGPLGASWASWRPSRVSSIAILDRVGPCRALLEATRSAPGALLGPFSGLSWAVFGAS